MNKKNHQISSRKVVIGNLKMNLVNVEERERYIKNFQRELQNYFIKDAGLILCVPDVHLEHFATEFSKHSSVFLGVQNCFWENSGAYTGEISPEMVKNLGGTHVIVGHSERRRYFGESNRDISKKIYALLKANISPVLCVGEIQEERVTGMTFSVLADQLQECLEYVSAANLEKIIFVYEPVWAVGSDRIPSSNEIMEAKLIIRKLLTEKYGTKHASAATILYGGSVSPVTAKAVCVDPGMDGVLVGRESLSPIQFLKIAEIISK